MFRLIPDQLRHRPLLLAVSGGPDSMAMVAHARDWHAQHPDLSLRAVIVDHGIRDNSKEEAETVQSWLDAMGITASIETVLEKAPKTGVQNWARLKRYEHLSDNARHDNAVIITAHHAEDQAETIAMRLAAGSGLGGLGGMKPQTRRGDIVILRPFLETSKDDLHQILKEQGIPFVQDPSNLNENFERIAWRQRLPALHKDGITPDLLTRLGKVSSHLDGGMRKAILGTLAGYWGVVPCGALWMDKEAVSQLPDLAALSLMRAIGNERGQAQWPVSHDAAETLLNALKTRHDDGVAMTLAGMEWYLKGGIIWVYPEAERPAPLLPIKEGVFFYDGMWRIRSGVAGDIVPMGEMRAAQFRKIAPDSLEAMLCYQDGERNYRAPMRALWRLPVLCPRSHPIQHSDNLSGPDTVITLEDGAIIPHLNRNKNLANAPADSFDISDCRPDALI